MYTVVETDEFQAQGMNVWAVLEPYRGRTLRRWLTLTAALKDAATLQACMERVERLRK